MKKFIAIFLTILITISSFTMVVAFASDIKSGKLNESVFWELSNGKLTVYGVGTVENPQSSSFIPWRKYADEIMQVEIKDGITGIGRAAFTKLKNVYNIPIPNSVTSIGQHAFSDCINLLNVKLPSNLKSLDTSAFYGCSNLKSVTIPKNITYMGGAVFEGCKNLTDVNIENGLKVIPSYTFSGCSSLTSIDIPSSVSSIEEYAFYNCSSLQNVSIAGQPKIANNAFERCALLENNKPSNESSNPIVNDQITVTLNGKLISFDVQPANISGRVLVPVRAIFEALGATVEWNGAKNEVISTKGDTTIKLYKDNNTMYKNGQPITLDVPAKNIDGRILVPVRAISEAFGCNVDWDGNTSSVIITSVNASTNSKRYSTYAGTNVPKYESVIGGTEYDSEYWSEFGFRVWKHIYLSHDKPENAIIYGKVLEEYGFEYKGISSSSSYENYMGGVGVKYNYRDSTHIVTIHYTKTFITVRIQDI